MSISQARKEALIQDHQTGASDTGSTPVQVALLTERIKNLTTHFKSAPGDKHSRHGMLKLVNQRRKLLKYLKRSDKPSYLSLIQSLKLRDSY